MAFVIGTEFVDLGAYELGVGTGLNIRDIHGQRTVKNEAYGRATRLRCLWSDGEEYTVGATSGVAVLGVPIRLSRFSSEELEVLVIGEDIDVTASVTDGGTTVTGTATATTLGLYSDSLTGAPLASDIDLYLTVSYVGSAAGSKICAIMVRETDATTSTIQ